MECGILVEIYLEKIMFEYYKFNFEKRKIMKIGFVDKVLFRLEIDGVFMISEDIADEALYFRGG